MIGISREAFAHDEVATDLLLAVAPGISVPRILVVFLVLFGLGAAGCVLLGLGPFLLDKLLHLASDLAVHDVGALLEGIPVVLEPDVHLHAEILCDGALEHRAASLFRLFSEVLPMHGMVRMRLPSSSVAKVYSLPSTALA